MSQVSLSYHNTPVNDSYQRSAELYELHENDTKKISISVLMKKFYKHHLLLIAAQQQFEKRLQCEKKQN
jgi:hypothetical protein